YANMRMKVKVLRALLRPNPPNMSMEDLEFATSTSTPQGPHKLATSLLGEAKELLAMDRYERRALSRSAGPDAARVRACAAHPREGNFESVDLTLLSIDEQKLPIYLQMRRMPLCEKTRGPARRSSSRFPKRRRARMSSHRLRFPSVSPENCPR